ncbi:MAG: hypothetical protein HYY50_01120 [Candidatus Kerfeldbacteria bacterium]|nr:hypothetical protein [Candidatus Kerfeldbacteria bacterium]
MRLTIPTDVRDQFRPLLWPGLGALVLVTIVILATQLGLVKPGPQPTDYSVPVTVTDQAGTRVESRGLPLPAVDDSLVREVSEVRGIIRLFPKGGNEYQALIRSERDRFRFYQIYSNAREVAVVIDQPPEADGWYHEVWYQYDQVEAIFHLPTTAMIGGSMRNE